MRKCGLCWKNEIYHWGTWMKTRFMRAVPFEWVSDNSGGSLVGPEFWFTYEANFGSEFRIFAHGVKDSQIIVPFLESDHKNKELRSFWFCWSEISFCSHPYVTSDCVTKNSRWMHPKMIWFCVNALFLRILYCIVKKDNFIGFRGQSRGLGIQRYDRNLRSRWKRKIPCHRHLC